NPGPAYNGVGPSPVLFSFSPDTFAVNPGPCTAPDIPVPGTNGCAPPVFPQSGFSGVDVFNVDQRIRTPYVQNYNFNIEQQLGPKTALQVGYVGSAGRKLFRYVDLNQTVAGGPRPFPTFEYINTFQSSASSVYNALQLTLKVRNWHGLHS